MFVFPSSCLSGLRHSLDLAKSVKTKHSIPTLYNFAVFRKVTIPCSEEGCVFRSCGVPQCIDDVEARWSPQATLVGRAPWAKAVKLAGALGLYLASDECSI